MANNPYVNKVVYGNSTVMDISDTTAEESDVDSGKVFYKANGERSTGTGSMSGAVWGQITGTLSDQSDLNTALGKKYATDDTLTTSISDNDTIPFSTPLGVKARIAFSKIKELVGASFRKLLKDTVGWIGNNLADMSKVEIGVNASGTANTKKARLIMPCESSKTYYVSANGTNRFTSVDYLTTATIPPEFPILEGGSLPYSIDTRSTDKYIIFQFNKETDVTQDDINVLKFMVSETNGDVYEPYHDNVDLTIDKKAELLVKDTVGWVGKNALPYPFKQGSASNRGITFTDNGDGTLTLNGTQNDASNNAVYQMHGAWNTTTLIFPAGQYRITTGTNNDDVIIGVSYSNQFLGATNNGVLDVNAPNGISYITCEVKKGAPQLTDVLVKPMVRDASIKDTTYEPYHKSVEDWYWENNPNAGAKNKFDFNDVRQNTIRRVSGTAESIKVKETTAGTYKNAAWYINVKPNTDMNLAVDVDVVTGVGFVNVYKEDGSGSALYQSAQITADTSVKGTFNTGNNTRLMISLFCTYSTSETGEVDYNNLMIWDARDTDSTYVPYAMTNRELTDAVTEVTSAFTNLPTGATVVNNFIKKIGNMCYGTLDMTGVNVASAWGLLANIPEGFEPRVNTFTVIVASSVATPINIGNSGGDSGGFVTIANVQTNSNVRMTAQWYV